jgi:hypothetical protein
VRGNQRGGNEATFFFPQKAVRECQVVCSGAGAEIGRTGAGFVNVVTKSGTNAVRSEAFDFNRNKELTSEDAFGRKLSNPQNKFGASMSGPIGSDRAFYFAAFEQNYVRVSFVVKFQTQPPGTVIPPELATLEGEQYGTNNSTTAFLRTDVQLRPRTRSTFSTRTTGCEAGTSASTRRSRTRRRRRTTCGSPSRSRSAPAGASSSASTRRT